MGVSVREKPKNSGYWWLFIRHQGQRVSQFVGQDKETADDAANLLLRTTQQEFPVVDGGQRLRGLVTREALITALKERGGAAPVLDFMHEVPAVPEKTGLETVMQTLNKSRAPAVGVVDRDGRFLGYINSENLGELIMIRMLIWSMSRMC